MSDVPVPDAAITAAAQALYKHFASFTHVSGNEMLRMERAARDALAATAPVIAAQAAAAERERIARLAEQHNAIYPAVTDSSDLVKALPFADLIRQRGTTT